MNNGKIFLPTGESNKKEEYMDWLQKIIHAITQVHPPHTLVIHFPIALTGAALFFILLALWKKSKILEQVAFANNSLAAASTIVAAIIGIRDNIVFYHGLAPNHIAKIILASTLFIITTGTAVARWKNKELLYEKTSKVPYVAAYFVSFAIASVLGFLGGIILFGM
jgi:uncharacterized membrane protein